MLLSYQLAAQVTERSTVPPVHYNISMDENGYYFPFRDKKIYELVDTPTHTLPKLMGNPTGTDQGIDFDFGSLNGTMMFGFIPYGDSKHPQPVYFRNSAAIVNGVASIDIMNQLKGTYDMVGWEQSGKGTLGYRLADQSGNFLYDGIISFTGSGPFQIATTMVEGPFVNLLTHESAVISFTLNQQATAIVKVGDAIFESQASLVHEVPVDGLTPDTEYPYNVTVGGNSFDFSLRTAPQPGTRSRFTFSYASDSRAGNGGGERDLGGANFYIMKRIMALNKSRQVAFMQFTGDLINGYLTNVEGTNVQYANWKRAIQPFAHYFPVYTAMGNHEALNMQFYSRENRVLISVDRFPYETESAEAVFAANFVNPTNGPVSEDGATYDPDPDNINFPSYSENVFHYTYDNVGMIVLNSDYWYAPTSKNIQFVGGGLHGYIMDNQLEWLAQALKQFEQDENIDHVFVTQHTPIFPNGGHVQDDMWYRGDNTWRPNVAGLPLEKGIIERRDQILDLLVNKSTKVVAVLTGDEHNYARTEIGPSTVIHPEDYQPEKVVLSRTIHQINNGAAGAPYYAQEETPWTPFVSGFTTQNALVLFHVEGEKVLMEVINPDTLEKFDELQLR
jgi:phosphodiesterase/alkaline phosphatase D-like protein